MIEGRELRREEIAAIWSLDRSERIDNVYTLEQGGLVLRPGHFEMQGWPPGEEQIYTPLLLDCYDRGGWFYGLYDDERPVAVAVLENKFIGPRHDRLQLKFLHVSRVYRGSSLGRQLFELARAQARKKGAAGLYISATPSQHTIDFYVSLGCRPTPDPDPELWALEPEDIHLECDI